MRKREPKGTTDVTVSQARPSFPESRGNEVNWQLRGGAD